MLTLPGWSPIAVPAQGALWTKWAKVKDITVQRQVAKDAHDMLGVHDWTRARIKYQREPAAADLWQSPAETLRAGKGDCEDYAILERALLKAIGYRADQLTLIVAHDLAVAMDHAVIFCGEHFLDCRATQVQHVSRFKDYRPIFGFTDRSMFVYGRTR